MCGSLQGLPGLISGLPLPESRLQLLAMWQYLALRRCNSAYLTAHWPASKIAVGLLRRQFFHPSFHTYLAMQGQPKENTGYMGVMSYFMPLAAFVVSIKVQATLVYAFEQYYPCSGASIRRDSSQRHGVGFGQAGFYGLREPELQLRQWVGVRIAFV